ncbi:unnamed protein product [Parajaminaea phylloscopi]
MQRRDPAFNQADRYSAPSAMRIPSVNSLRSSPTEPRRMDKSLPPLMPLSGPETPLSRRLPHLPPLSDDIRDHRPLTRSRSNSLRRAASTSTVPPPIPSLGPRHGIPHSHTPLSDRSGAHTPGHPMAMSEAGYSPPSLLEETQRRHSSQWERPHAGPAESMRSDRIQEMPPPQHSHHAQPHFFPKPPPAFASSPRMYSHHQQQQPQPQQRDSRQRAGEMQSIARMPSPPAWSGHTNSTPSLSRFYAGSGHAPSLPPLSSLTQSLSTPTTPPIHRSSPAKSGDGPTPLSHMGVRKRSRGWEDMALGERHSLVQTFLHNFTRRLVAAIVANPEQRFIAQVQQEIADHFFVTVTCSHSGVAQKSYGHEKRFLCPPPIVRVRGPGYTTPSGSPDVARLLRVCILPGVGEAGHLSQDGSAPAIVSEEIILDRTLQAKFGHLHVGGSTNSAKTFRLRFEMLKTGGPSSSEAHHEALNVPTSGVPSMGDGGSYKSPRLSDGPLGRPYAMNNAAASLPWLTRDSDAISVISKPSKKTTKAKTSSSQITPDLAICLFNRVNSQNVRTKYMAVDDGQLSARNDSWTTFHMRPVASAHSTPAASGDAVTYGSIVVLEAPGQGTVSDPMVVCKVEKGKIIIPPAFAEPTGTSNGHGHGPRGRASLGLGNGVSVGSSGEGGADGPISQMQKVAFMRYEPPRSDYRQYPGSEARYGHHDDAHHGGPSRGTTSSRRTFLCSAPPEPWWQSPGAGPHDRQAAAAAFQRSLTAPMRPLHRPDGRGSDNSGFQADNTAQDSSYGAGDSAANRSEHPSNPHKVVRPPLASGLSEPLSPTPLTFMPTGRAPEYFTAGLSPNNLSRAGPSVKDADVANDAFCWSVVGASHFEFSFSKIGLPADGTADSSTAETPVGNVPVLNEVPRIFHETHILRLGLDRSKSPSTTAAAWEGWHVWLGGMGPLPRVDGNASFLDLRLPTLETLLQYCRSVYDETSTEGRNGVHSSPMRSPGADVSRPSPRYETGTSGPAQRRLDHGLPTALPIVMAKDYDGTLCKTAYALELFRAADHHSLAIRVTDQP